MMVAIFYLIGHVGGSRTVTAINPMESNATTGQATTERSERAPSQQAPRQ